MPKACRDTSSSCHGTSAGSEKSQGISVGKASSQEPCPSPVGTRQFGLIHKQTTQRDHCDCTGERAAPGRVGNTFPAGTSRPGKLESDRNTARTREKEKPGPHSVPHALMPGIQSFLGAPQGGGAELGCTTTPIPESGRVPDKPCPVLLQQRQKTPSFQVPRSCLSGSWSRSLKCASCSDFEALEQEFEENPVHPHAQHTRAQQQLWGTTVRQRGMVRARQGNPAQGFGDKEDTEISRCHINSCDGNGSSRIKYLPRSGTGV